jgi:phosphotriesterase-related protein
MRKLITTLGPIGKEELGLILPHEHIFVDLRTYDQPGFSQADPAAVIKLMGPEIARARASGLTALVECSPVGVGRRIDILKAVSDATNFPLVVPTGIYREPWVPPWAFQASEDELCDWMQGELEDEIEHTGVQAGFIKLSAGDDGITPVESKILHAAARAARASGSVIGSHSIRGKVVRAQLEIIENCGCSPNRFIWIHANAEPEVQLNLEMARRGVWIEYDGIGSDPSDEEYIGRIRRLLEAGLGNRILLSQDRGWYDPAQPGGGTPRHFTYLAEQFLPKLRAAGIDEATILQFTCDNPFNAFSR